MVPPRPRLVLPRFDFSRRDHQQLEPYFSTKKQITVLRKGAGDIDSNVEQTQTLGAIQASPSIHDVDIFACKIENFPH